MARVGDGIPNAPSSSYDKDSTIIGVGKLKSDHYLVFERVAPGKRRAEDRTNAAKSLKQKKAVPIAEDSAGKVVTVSPKAVSNMIGKEKLAAILKQASGIADQKEKLEFVENSIALALKNKIEQETADSAATTLRDQQSTILNQNPLHSPPSDR